MNLLAGFLVAFAHTSEASPSVDPTAWQYVATYGTAVVVFGAFIALAYWGHRRRVREVADSNTNADKPDANMFPPPSLG